MSQERPKELLYRYIDWRDRHRLQQAPVAHMPPASLRFRVHGDLSMTSFLASGRQCSQDIRDALARIDKDIASFQHVLDFGCGCGRTIIWFANQASPPYFYGTDIDAAAIDWCRRCLPFAVFETNQPVPPLNYSDGTFDLIYAISVFTHLDEDYQFRWLAELQRVTKSKGYVLLTVHGFYYWSKMQPEEINAIRQTGFMFVRAPKYMQGIFPEWYQNAFHAREYILAEYSKYFDIVEYIPSGLDQCQDIVLLQKR